MGWFTSTSIDTDMLEWEIIRWNWLLANLGARFDFSRIPLVMPTRDHFPVGGGTPEQNASAIFRRVQTFFGVETWPCRLEPFDEAASLVNNAAPILACPETSQGAAGYFEQNESREIVIRYNRNQLRDPISLIATMAHEVSHYVLATVRVPPPGGNDQREPLTDLTAVLFGFGIFLADSSFHFSQWQSGGYQGWSSRGQGYLSQHALSLALALFCTTKNLPLEPVQKFLTPNPRHYFKAYAKELLKRHGALIAKLQAAEKPAGRAGFACPGCELAPIAGNLWMCSSCHTPFDTFESQAVCPACKETHPTTQCLSCHQAFPIQQWKSAPATGVKP